LAARGQRACAFLSPRPALRDRRHDAGAPARGSSGPWGAPLLPTHGVLTRICRAAQTAAAPARRAASGAVRAGSRAMYAPARTRRRAATAAAAARASHAGTHLATKQRCAARCTADRGPRLQNEDPHFDWSPVYYCFVRASRSTACSHFFTRRSGCLERLLERGAGGGVRRPSKTAAGEQGAAAPAASGGRTRRLTVGWRGSFAAGPPCTSSNPLGLFSFIACNEQGPAGRSPHPPP
jgi:hypothetical protein